MRRAVVGSLMILMATVPACVEPTLDVTGSALAFADALCGRDIDAALEYVHEPLYRGREGPTGREEVRRMLNESTARTPLFCPTKEKLDHDAAETLSPDDLERRVNVTITDEIAGYQPGERDVYVLIPMHPNPNSDDPLQGFWRPVEDRWLHVALFS